MAAAELHFAIGNYCSVLSSRDEKTKRFVTVLFPLLLDEGDVKSSSMTEKNSESSSSEESLAGDIIESQEKLYDYAQKVCESVIFCYVFMRDPHLKVTKLYFSKYTINPESVYKFIKNYLHILSAQSPSIHFAVLHSLAFVYHVIEFCVERGHTEFKKCIPIWWEYRFYKTFKEQFFIAGHWEAFTKYASTVFYSDITKSAFRSRFKLTSPTLGCKFSNLEFSDTDVPPPSEDSEGSSEEIEVVSPYGHFNAKNDIPIEAKESQDSEGSSEEIEVVSPYGRFSAENDIQNEAKESQDSEGSSEEIEVVSPYGHFIAENDDIPIEAKESQSTYSTNGNLKSLNNSYIGNLEQKENYNPNLENRHSRNTTLITHNVDEPLDFSTKHRDRK